MPEIANLFHINASRQKVYEALTDIDQLSKWWTKQTSGSSTVNGFVEFRFGPKFMNKMKVLELKPAELVKWECVESAPEWIGTHITFVLDENEGKTRVRFNHRGWKETGDFYAACSFSWARFMMSLRDLCEKGKGTPFEGE